MQVKLDSYKVNSDKLIKANQLSSMKMMMDQAIIRIIWYKYYKKLETYKEQRLWYLHLKYGNVLRRKASTGAEFWYYQRYRRWT